MRAKGLQASAEFKLAFPGSANLTLATWHCVSFNEMYRLEREMREM